MLTHRSAHSKCGLARACACMMCMYVYVCACVHGRMHACMHACMHVCMYGLENVCKFVRERAGECAHASVGSQPLMHRVHRFVFSASAVPVRTLDDIGVQPSTRRVHNRYARLALFDKAAITCRLALSQTTPTCMRVCARACSAAASGVATAHIRCMQRAGARRTR
jgi:hypothetical protein